MKKLFLIIIILILFNAGNVYATVNVKDLYPAFKNWNYATNTVSVPAKIIKSLGNKAVIRSLALDLAPSIGGGLVAGLLISGAYYAGNAAFDYFLQQSPQWYYLNDQLVRNISTEMHPPSCDDVVIARIRQAHPEYDMVGACYTSRGADCPIPAGYTDWYQDNGFYHNGFQYIILVYYMCEGYWPSQNCNTYARYYCNAVITEDVPTPIPEADVRNQVIDDLLANVGGNTLINNVVDEALDNASDLVNNGQGLIVHTNPTQKVMDVLNDAIPETTEQAMDYDLANDIDTTTVDEVAENVEVTQNTLTKDQVKDAVKDALNDSITQSNKLAANETLGALQPLVQPTEPPDKGTIATIVNTFLNGLANLPIISFFTNMKNISFSGSCSTTFPIPNIVGTGGGDTTVDFCQFQDIFAIMGSILLSVTGIVWTMYLFEG